MTSDLERHNGNRFILSNGLQGLGDQIVSAKTVLPWLLGAAGAPGFFIALLVPVREAGSMLPQAALSPWVTTQPSRKKVWMIGAAGQALAAAGIALAAVLLSGVALGLAVVVLLGVLALFRALNSISSKDVQGRTISKGLRGRITGRATALGGLIALVVGVFLWFLDSDLPQWLLALLLAVGAASWAAAVVIFGSIREPDSQEEEQGLNRRWWADTWGLFTQDAKFRRFVIVRSLLLVTSLSTAFVVALSQQIGHDISGLGAFVVASAAASLVTGRISGIWSDASSKSVMAYGSAAASAVIVLVVAAAHFSPDRLAPFALPLGFFLIQVAHTAVRVARKTYIVDMAEGNQRTRYTGAANTIMGLILLIVGMVSGVIAIFGASITLLFLAAVGVIGVVGATRLDDVSRNP